MTPILVVVFRRAETTAFTRKGLSVWFSLTLTKTSGEGSTFFGKKF
jgi:hypothetical protein